MHFFKIFYKIHSCSGKRSTYGASDDQNELDDLVGFRTFGAQKSVENLKDNLTAKLIFWKSTSSLLLTDA